MIKFPASHERIAEIENAPAILNQITAKVLRYHPKPKTKAAKRRIRRKKRLSKRKGN